MHHRARWMTRNRCLLTWTYGSSKTKYLWKSTFADYYVATLRPFSCIVPFSPILVLVIFHCILWAIFCKFMSLGSRTKAQFLSRNGVYYASSPNRVCGYFQVAAPFHCFILNVLSGAMKSVLGKIGCSHIWLYAHLTHFSHWHFNLCFLSSLNYWNSFKPAAC